MLKKIAVILLLINLFSFSKINVHAAESENKVIDLNIAIEMGVKNSNVLKLYDDKIVYASKRYQLALAQSYAAKGKGWDTDINLISNKKEELLYPIQRLNIANDLKIEKINSQNTLKHDIVNAYFKILNQDKQIKLQEDAIARMNVEISAKEKQVSLGLDIANAISNLKISLNQEEKKLDTLVRNKKSLIIEMNTLLGQRPEEPLVLKDQSLDTKEFIVDDINSLIGIQMEKNYSIIKANKDLEESKIEYDIVKRFSNKAGTNGIEEIEDRILDREKIIKDKKSELTAKILKDYNNILNLYDDVKITELEVIKCEKDMEITNYKYKLGKITFLESEKVKSNLDSAVFQNNQAALEYFLAVEDFTSDTGLVPQ